MEQLSFLWMDLMKFWYFEFFFRKSVKKIQVLLESDKNNGYFIRRRFHIYDDTSLNSSWEWELSQIKVVRKIKTHILCWVLPPPKVVPLWDNVEKCGRAREATNDNMAHTCFMLDKQGYTDAHAHTHAPWHLHAHTQVRHARFRARTHTHINM
jgi:hypothetical protein